MPIAANLRDDALAIWQAGVDAVHSERLVQQHVRVEANRLLVGGDALPLGEVRRIAVVGAGKAGAGMAAGLERALGPRVLADKRVAGWMNVPADCVRRLSHIHLHAARPAGVNEPTEEGLHGAEQILRLVGELGASDLCFCLISGGGSALLPAPVPGVSLAEKQALTRHLSAAGANIQQLNTVRKQLSRIKGGGLARACRAGRLVTLIISDVLGDPLDVIASGPTVQDRSTPQEALAVLTRFGAVENRVAPAAVDYLRKRLAASAPHGADASSLVTNLVIGNNALAVEAAGREAASRGYQVETHSAAALEGAAEDIGRDLAGRALEQQRFAAPRCLVTGGEPIVRLAPPEIRGLGGRNQQLVLAALVEMLRLGTSPEEFRSALVSGGTDGEDGPTDAAGAAIDAALLRQLRQSRLDPADFLRRSDAYRFFEALGGLIKTGPTHTNVCDLRVVVSRPQ